MRFLVDAEIEIERGPRLTTAFVASAPAVIADAGVVAPNEDTAFDIAHDYLTEGGWLGEHVVSSSDRVGELIVHDLAIRRMSAERIARTRAEARVSPRKRGAR